MTAISDLINSKPATQSPNNSTATLGQDEFLKLMTVQLTTQDPFNPVDNTQMLAQMAQFSSVAGIAEINQSLKGISEALNPSRLTDAASWIGRSMLVSSDVATPLADGAYAGEVALPENADAVSISFVDQSGAVVHTQSAGAKGKGAFPFTWDGKNAAGEPAATGPLKIVVTATAAGKPVETATATWTQIGGIQSPASGGATQLVTGLGLLSPDEAIRLA